VISLLQKRRPIHSSSILLAGPVRNVEAVITHEVNALRNAFLNFKEVHVLIVESDSTDNTLNELSVLKNTVPNFNYVSLGTLKKTLPKRTQRIARARNEIIDAILNNRMYANIDFIAMADMDGMNNLITPQKIAQCWEVKESWDVVTAVQQEDYYDVWTLRHPDWSPVDCWAQKERLELLFGEPAAVNLAVSAKQIQLRPEFGMIEVDAAFGGLGIYKREAFIAGRFAGLDSNNNEVSDHIAFYQDLKEKKFRVYINCALVNCSKYPEQLAPEQPPKLKPILRVIQKMGFALLGEKRFNDYLKRLLSSP
jgi:glycosyltransferase involved in cell wall biosynthesis